MTQNNTWGNTNSKPKKRRSEEEEYEDDTTPSPQSHLNYLVRTETRHLYTIPIDESFKDAVYYRYVTKIIADSEKYDQIEFEISSPGGALNGLVALLTAMERTEATTVAHINGECYSAASMLALNCNIINVSPHSSMLVHFMTFGASGKSTDVLSQVKHGHSSFEKLFRQTYKHFLTDIEIDKCIDGLELWLSAEDVVKRLERKFKLLKKEYKNSK